MCLPHVFLKLLRVEWKANHLDKSLKKKSTVPRIFQKISETKKTREKMWKLQCVKGCFSTLSRLLVSDFLLFNVLFWSSMKKFKVSGSWVLGPCSWVFGFGSQVLCPGSRVLDPVFWDPGVPVLRSWFLILGYAVQDNIKFSLSSHFSVLSFSLLSKPVKL